MSGNKQHPYIIDGNENEKRKKVKVSGKNTRNDAENGKDKYLKIWKKTSVYVGMKI